MQKRFTLIFSFAILALTFSLILPKEVFARPASQSDMPTPAEVIDAVNNLRLAYGVPPLRTHQILMQIAQTEADGIAAGMPGHWRPNNMTLGQWMLSLGYPLLGDLSQDGYRSENFSFGDASTIDAIESWRGDEPHLNTMLSTNRSDIGAGIALMEDGSYVFVIETAWQTKSGKMQWDAYPILTGIPLTQAAFSGNATQVAGSGGGDGSVPQYINPVAINTALSDGNVYHKVQYGQTLWSIAIAYGTTIDKIRALNNLGSDNPIYPNQVLLIQQGATQPSPATSTPASTPTVLASIVPSFPTATPSSSATMTAIPVSTTSNETLISLALPIGAIVAAFLIGGFFLRATARKPAPGKNPKKRERWY